MASKNTETRPLGPMLEEEQSRFLGEIGVAIVKVLHRTNLRRMYPCCLTCVYWQGESETCKLAQMRPPAHVIVNGCEQYFDIDDIPF